MQLLRGAVRAHMPGRVLLNAAPEWSPNVQVYREDEFIRRDQAFDAGVRATMAVPLFFLDDDSDAGEVRCALPRRPSRAARARAPPPACSALRADNALSTFAPVPTGLPPRFQRR